MSYSIKPEYEGAVVQIMNTGSKKCCRGMIRVITLSNDTPQNDMAYLFITGHPGILEIKEEVKKKPIIKKQVVEAINH